VVTYRGRWLIAVIGKNSAWDQRVAITGASNGVTLIAGVVGTPAVVEGTTWNLTIQHNDGSGWKENEGVLPDPLQENGAQLTQVVRSKDHYTPTDTVPDDLVIEAAKIGPMFELPVRPYAVDAGSLLMLADGVFVGINGLQYMGVDVVNTWGEAFTDELLFDISDLGRATLASFGIVVQDSWHPNSLAATQQTLLGRAIRLPPLDIGQRTTVFFQVDASAAHRGKPDVEFVLLNLGGTPDPANAMRHNARAIFIAEVSYDRTTGTVFGHIPEGTLTLQLKSAAIDAQALKRLCRHATAPSSQFRLQLSRIMAQAKGGHCDQRTLRSLLLLICQCLTEGAAARDGREYACPGASGCR
jgi:hypothetical protein